MGQCLPYDNLSFHLVRIYIFTQIISSFKFVLNVNVKRRHVSRFHLVSSFCSCFMLSKTLLTCSKSNSVVGISSCITFLQWSSNLISLEGGTWSGKDKFVTPVVSGLFIEISCQ